MRAKVNCSFVQPLKALLPMVCNISGRVTNSRSTQSSKALAGMTVSVEGKITEVILMLLLKRLAPNPVTSSGMAIAPAATAMLSWISIFPSAAVRKWPPAPVTSKESFVQFVKTLGLMLAGS